LKELKKNQINGNILCVHELKELILLSVVACAYNSSPQEGKTRGSSLRPAWDKRGEGRKRKKKNMCYKNNHTTQAMYRFNEITVYSNDIFPKNRGNNPQKFVCNHKRPGIATAILRKRNRARGI
jgi:hypothetical protein